MKRAFESNERRDEDETIPRREEGGDRGETPKVINHPSLGLGRSDRRQNGRVYERSNERTRADGDEEPRDAGAPETAIPRRAGSSGCRMRGRARASAGAVDALRTSQR